jgi:hypothetical protein
MLSETNGARHQNLRVRNGDAPNKSLDASGGSVFRNLLRAAEGALIRAAASTQTFGGSSYTAQDVMRWEEV